jgi:hypothetical protein
VYSMLGRDLSLSLSTHHIHTYVSLRSTSHNHTTGTVPQLCSQDNSIILTSDLEKGCNQKDTNLICCVLKEDEVEDKDENKCEESDLDEIKKTRDSCGKVIGGSKLRKEDGEIDYNSCLCEEVEECTCVIFDEIALSSFTHTFITHAHSTHTHMYIYRYVTEHG